MHALDRLHQLETKERIVQSRSPVVIVEAPVGSGKTAWPASIGYDRHRVMALVKTKSLQGQYEGGYDFAVVKGKSNYDCLHNLSGAADMCQIDKEDYELKELCESTCPYPVACQNMLGSYRASLNYAKYFNELRGEFGLVNRYRPEYLFLDEAHQLSDITIEQSGISMEFSRVDDYIGPIALPDNQPMAVSMAINWLENLLDTLKDNKPSLGRKPYTPEVVKAYRKWSNLVARIESTLDSTGMGNEYWFAYSTDDGIHLKPLTARFHFPSLFEAKKVVLMSATIGNHRSFAAELGIMEFDSLTVPNIYPGFMRPVYDLQAPKVHYKMTEEERQEHARVIAKAINDCPNDWNGLIHVPSRKMATDLKWRLVKLTRRPIWVCDEGLGTEAALASWLHFDSSHRGALAVTWQFFEGVDLPNLCINITACVPYPDMKAPFEKARFDFDPKAAQCRIANTIEQQQGRNRRGYPAHYGMQATKFNAIADAKWERMKWAFSQSFLESITT